MISRYSTSQVSCKEIAHYLYELLAFLVLWHVRRLRKGVPFHLLNSTEERQDHAILGLVVLAVQEQRRNVDLVQVIDDRPSFQRTGDVEFRGTIPISQAIVREVELIESGYVHRIVHRWIPFECAEDLLYVLRYWVEHADVPLVELRNRFLIFRGLGRTRGLMLFQDALCRLKLLFREIAYTRVSNQPARLGVTASAACSLPPPTVPCLRASPR